MDWQPIKDAPRTDERILVAFFGQFGWVYFTALANGEDTQAAGFAKPTIWCKIVEPAETWKEEKK